MIKLENFEVLGWEHAIRGMRNPMNSWEKGDSWFRLHCDELSCDDCPAREYPDCTTQLGICNCKVGPNDHELMMKLAKGGPVHAKYRRMITVYVDITAPLYWWKEFDTYKVGTVANSCSTMHKIHAKEFTMDDFSREHIDGAKVCAAYGGEMLSSWDVLYVTVAALNHHRRMFLETNDKKYWWQMIQLLPTSYNQKRTVMLNYEVLTGIYHSRRAHKLDEWHDFCDWIESLPYSEIIIGGTEDE